MVIHTQELQPCLLGTELDRKKRRHCCTSCFSLLVGQLKNHPGPNKQKSDSHSVVTVHTTPQTTMTCYKRRLPTVHFVTLFHFPSLRRPASRTRARALRTQRSPTHTISNTQERDAHRPLRERKRQTIAETLGGSLVLLGQPTNNHGDAKEERKLRKEEKTKCVCVYERQRTNTRHTFLFIAVRTCSSPPISPPSLFLLLLFRFSLFCRTVVLLNRSVPRTYTKTSPPTRTPPKAVERGSGRHNTGGTGGARDRNDDAVPVAGTTRPLSPLSPPTRSTGDAPLRRTECCRKTCPSSQR